jgi:hypothetical protein
MARTNYSHEKRQKEIAKKKKKEEKLARKANRSDDKPGEPMLDNGEPGAQEPQP